MARKPTNDPTLILAIAGWWLRRQFTGTLCSRLNHFTPGQRRLVRKAIEQKSRQILGKSKNWIQDYQSFLHLNLAAVSLASYLLLTPEIGNEDGLLGVLAGSFADFYRRSGLPLWIQVRLRFSRDPYAFFLGSYKAKWWLKLAFGKSFAFDVQEKRSEFTFEVRHCIYNDFLKANGVPQLISIFCAADDMWSRLIQPRKHGIRFDRPTTLARGGDVCQFRFVRLLRQQHRL